MKFDEVNTNVFVTGCVANRSIRFICPHEFRYTAFGEKAVRLPKNLLKSFPARFSFNKVTKPKHEVHEHKNRKA